MSGHLWIVVPAAGYGERMGGETPKQYLNLAGQSMLQHTLSRLLAVPELAGIVVALAPDDKHWPTVEAGHDPLVHTTYGGQTRAASVVSGLQCVLRHAPESTWVLVHDAARPLVSLSDIQRLCNAVYNSGAVGGILATPVHDTLKKADGYFQIEKTVSRQSLWQAQTPQLFRANELLDALFHATANKGSTMDPVTGRMMDAKNPTPVNDAGKDTTGSDNPAPNWIGHGMTEVPITDEASAMERMGHEPLLVEALEPNFKITRPVDMQIATAILESSMSGTS